MKLQTVLSLALLLAGIPILARADTISDFNAILTASSPTQLGRPSRNGVQQTWTGAETYPGIINPTVRYQYGTYTFAGTLFTGANFVEISVFDPIPTSAVFVSAYAGSYNPASPATNWLGDEGGSGNYFGPNDARFFDVFLPFGQNLTLLVNDSAAAGLNDPIAIDVSAYGNTAYGDAVPTPEPSTLITLGTGLAGIAAAARRRFTKHCLPEPRPSARSAPMFDRDRLS